jgi:hypothetical protein
MWRAFGNDLGTLAGYTENKDHKNKSKAWEQDYSQLAKG